MKSFILVALLLVGAYGAFGSFSYADQGSWGGSCSNNIRQSPIDIPCQQYLKTCPPSKGYQIYWENPALTFGASTAEDIKTVYTNNSWVRFSNQTNDYLFKSWQFHFHYPSEHTVDGKSYPLEIHYVHQLDSTTVAEYLVVGIFFEEDANLTYDIFDAAPVDSNTTFIRLFPFALTNKPAYHYLGSLTTPPCLELVNWFVQKEPIKIKPASLKRIISRMKEPNNRIVQRLGSRTVSLVGKGC